jgi:Malectin domain
VPRSDDASRAEGQTRDQQRAAGGNRQTDAGNREERQPRKDDSRRNGSSRGAAAPDRQHANADGNVNEDPEPRDTRRQDRQGRAGGVPEGWSDDRYFEGGSALDWSGDVAIAGTDDDGLYLTQRSGSGPGKRRGFNYAIPLEASGTYLVRLYFAEPYWGAPDGPNGDAGRRVFSVTAEGDSLLEDLDIFAEAGSLTALVKQVEVEVSDGELNLHFTAS